MSVLKVGDKAPLFVAYNQHNQRVSLLDFKGKKIILFFYPKDNTPGCTTEACSLRDGYPMLKDAGFEVLGISTDTQSSHLKFANKFQLKFQLLVDEDKQIVEQYGIWVDKNMYGKIYKGTARTTFILDEDFTITHIINKVDTKNATQQILDLI